tara:strand:+ start:474 stop:869 length:396 start_codon:yes stop_codon:yes gene_type:complete
MPHSLKKIDGLLQTINENHRVFPHADLADFLDQATVATLTCLRVANSLIHWLQLSSLFLACRMPSVSPWIISLCKELSLRLLMPSGLSLPPVLANGMPDLVMLQSPAPLRIAFRHQLESLAHLPSGCNNGP